MKNARELAGKVSVTGDIGEALDERLSALMDEVQQKYGAHAALQEFVKTKADSLAVAVDKAKKEGGIDKLLKEPGWADLPADVQVARYAKRVIDQMKGMLLNFAQVQKNLELVASGKVVATKDALTIVSRHHTNNAAQVQQLLAAEQEAAESAVAEDQAKSESAPDESTLNRHRPKPHGTLAERRAEAAADRAASAKEPEAVKASDTQKKKTAKKTKKVAKKTRTK